MAEYCWLAGWYASRLHAVPTDKVPSGHQKAQGVCGNWVYGQPPTPWAIKKFNNGVPRCKHCERILGTPNSVETDLARVTAERDLLEPRTTGCGRR